MESRQLKAPALRALALAAVYMGFLALLTIPGVAAQGKDPGDGPADVSREIEGLQDAVAGPKPSQRYPRLDSTLNGVVEDYEVRRSSARSAASQAPVHSASSVAVTIYLNANVAATRSFLKNNGGDPRNVGEDYIEAYVPVTLLGQLSQQPGVLRVEAIVGRTGRNLGAATRAEHPDAGPVPDGAGCPFGHGNEDGDANRELERFVCVRAAHRQLRALLQLHSGAGLVGDH